MAGRRDRVLVYTPARADDYARELQSSAGGPTLDVRVAHSPMEARSLAAWPDIFLGAALDSATLLTMPRLGWIQWVWAGVDRLMADPLFAAAVTERRLRLTRAVGVFGRRIAEYVLAYCLCHTQDIPRVLEAQRRRLWQRFEPDTLRGKRLGVAGLGSIGLEVASLAAAVGMEVWGLKRHPAGPALLPAPVAAPAAPPGPALPPAPVARVFGPAEIPAFVAELDFLVLTLPLTAETRGIVSAGVLERMRPSSVLINVGRGGLVNEEALVQGLKSGRPGWAVLDVVQTEPLPPESELWTLPNVIITPHLAGPSTPSDIIPLFLRNLEAFRAGRPLEGEVRGDLGY